MVNFFTSTSTLLIKHRKTQYTFSVTFSHYNQTPEMGIAQISIFFYTFTFPTLISHVHFSFQFHQTKPREAAEAQSVEANWPPQPR